MSKFSIPKGRKWTIFLVHISKGYKWRSLVFQKSISAKEWHTKRTYVTKFGVSKGYMVSDDVWYFKRVRYQMNKRQITFGFMVFNVENKCIKIVSMSQLKGFIYIYIYIYIYIISLIHWDPGQLEFQSEICALYISLSRYIFYSRIHLREPWIQTVVAIGFAWKQGNSLLSSSTHKLHPRGYKRRIKILGTSSCSDLLFAFFLFLVHQRISHVSWKIVWAFYLDSFIAIFTDCNT